MVNYTGCLSVSFGTMHGCDEDVHPWEKSLLSPAYYKAYIIRLITGGETSGRLVIETHEPDRSVI